MTPRRFLVGFVVVALVAVALVIDPSSPRRPVDVDVVPAAAFAPVATADDASSSTWYCVAGTAAKGGAADHRVVVANPTDRAAEGRMEIFPTEGDPVIVPLQVAAGSRESIAVGTKVEATFAAAVIELTAGGVVAEHEVLGTAGWDMGRCASAPSTAWYFAWGRTAGAANLSFALLNPFPEDAVVDLTFETEEGFVAPTALEGMLVPARRLVVVNVTEQVSVRARVATTVSTRAGRIVAERIQTVVGADGVSAVDLSLGAPAPAKVWNFAEGRADAATGEQFSVFNPTDEPAEVEIVIERSGAGTGGAPAPFEIRVPAGGAAQIVLNQETRIALPVRHTTTVRSVNGVPVVAERVTATGSIAKVLFGDLGIETSFATTTTTAAPTTTSTTSTTTTAPPAAPSTTTTTATTTTTTTTTTPAPAAVTGGLVVLPTGFSATLGSPVVAGRWVAATGGRDDLVDASLSVLNVTTAELGLTVTAWDKGRATPLSAPAKIGPGQRLEIPLVLAKGATGYLVVVEATGAIVVDRLQPSARPAEIAVLPAIPAPGGGTPPVAAS